MENKREKPDYIKNFARPQGTEIKHINGHWYLYERLSVYDSETKKKRKKSGKMLGTITPEGFVPRRDRIPDAGSRAIENLEYGASVFLYALAGDNGIPPRLQECFPGLWREILAMAIITCREQSPFKRMEYHYSVSYLSQLLGPLSISPSSITSLLKKIGTDREAIRSYMGKDLTGGIIMFDGHRMVSGSRTMEYARLGYDSRMRFKPQINLIYLFRADEARRLPVYYKQFSGDVPDVKAFVDTVSDANLSGKDVTLLADKGFGSDENFDFLEERGIPYIVPLKRGSREAPAVPASQKGYDKVFTYRGRTIFCKEIVETGKGSNVFLFYDMELANDESCDMVGRQNKTNAGIKLRIEREKERRAKGRGRLSDAEFAKLRPVDVASFLNERENTGTFAVKTTRTDLNCMQIYSLYKTRQDIEQCFKSFDNTLDRSASYMRDIHSYEAWQFISHIALQLFYSVLDTIEAKGFTSRYSFKDILFRLKDVRVNKINDAWRMTKITKSTMSVCENLGIEIDAPEVIGAP